MRLAAHEKCLRGALALPVKAGLLIGAGAAIMLVPALLNGFPFVFPDSVDYLLFNYYLPFRSAYYGLFILFFHLNRFVWLPVLAQALIASHLIWTVSRIHLPNLASWKFAALIMALTLGSSLPIFAGFILADIFTPVMILSVYLLAFQLDRLTVLERVYFFLLACVATAVHLSHLAIATALLTVIIAVYALTSRLLASVRLPLALAAAPVFLGALAILAQNLLIHRVFALSPAGSSFFLANMIEQGPARRYLESACPAASYKICAELEQLPATSEGILFMVYPRLGGFMGVRGEAATILKETIRSRPHEVATMGLRLVGLSLQRRVPGAELGPLPHLNASFMEKALQQKFGPIAVEAQKASAQAHDRIPRDYFRAIDAFVFPVSAALLIAVTAYAGCRRQEEPFALGACILGGFAANIVVCALTSGVYDRFQARVSWLLPLGTLLLLGRFLGEKRAVA